MNTLIVSIFIVLLLALTISQGYLRQQVTKTLIAYIENQPEGSGDE